MNVCSIERVCGFRAEVWAAAEAVGADGEGRIRAGVEGDLLTFVLNGERMRNTAGDLCSVLVFVLCYYRRIRTRQPGSSPRRKGRLCCRMWIFGISEDKI